MKLTHPARTLLAASVIASGMLGAHAAHAQTPAPTPWWRDTLGYAQRQISTVRVGADRFPYVEVHIGNAAFWLLFDTGNQVGLTLETRHYEQLGLPRVGSTRRRDSSGELIGEYRVGTADRVEALGHTVADVTIYEFRHERIAGLFGPLDIRGSRFTLDYRAGAIAVSDGPLPATTSRRDARRLVRSEAHPRLILVEGQVRGQTVLIELDTGKSRTVIDPAWAVANGLVVGDRDTIVVGDIRLGDAVFHVTDAKPVSLEAIDPGLATPLSLSLGSDILARFVMTVDYSTGSILLWRGER